MHDGFTLGNGPYHFFAEVREELLHPHLFGQQLQPSILLLERLQTLRFSGRQAEAKCNINDGSRGKTSDWIKTMIPNVLRAR